MIMSLSLKFVSSLLSPKRAVSLLPHCWESLCVRFIVWGLPGGSDRTRSTCSAGDLNSVPGLGRPPETGIATHSSILAWRIPQTEETGRLQSTGLQRAGCGWHFHFSMSYFTVAARTKCHRPVGSYTQDDYFSLLWRIQVWDGAPGQTGSGECSLPRCRRWTHKVVLTRRMDEGSHRGPFY